MKFKNKYVLVLELFCLLVLVGFNNTCYCSEILTNNHLSEFEASVKSNKLTANSVVKDKLLPSFDNRSQKKAKHSYLGLNLNLGSVSGIEGFFGFYPGNTIDFIPESIALSITYSFSNQKYTSAYFIEPNTATSINFHEISFGISNDIDIKLNRITVLFVAPECYFGLEMLNSKDLLFDSKAQNLVSAFFKPGLKTGIRFSKFGFSFGAHYYLFESYVRKENFQILIDSKTKERIKWDDDLFHDRSGFQFNIGIFFKL
jgi:hypothetical protein